MDILITVGIFPPDVGGPASFVPKIAKKFEDPMRRTPNIDKIIKFTGIKPSMGIEDMIKEIVAYKK